MSMNGSKPLFASKSIWGGLVALGAGVAGFFGYEVSAGDQAGLAEHVTSVIAAVGGALAIWGRIVASKRIGRD